MKQVWFLVVIFVFSGFASRPGFSAEWRHYSNPTYGTSAQVPAWFKADPAAEDADGQRFVAPNGRGSINVYASELVLAGGLAAYRRDRLSFLKAEGWNLTYTPQRKTWFVLSGLRDGEILYLRAAYHPACGDGRVHHIEYLYPKSEKKDWTRIITKGSRSLRGPC